MAQTASVHGRVLKLRRLRAAHGRPLKAWACPVAQPPHGPPPACTHVVIVRNRPVTLKLPPTMHGKVRVVVVLARRARRR